MMACSVTLRETWAEGGVSANALLEGRGLLPSSRAPTHDARTGTGGVRVSGFRHEIASAIN